MSSTAENILSHRGFFLDELTQKMRLLHPNDHHLTQDIILDSKEYLQASTDFFAAIRKLAEIPKAVAELADREKLEMIGRRSRLLIELTEGPRARQQMKVELQDRKEHLEKLTEYHESLLRVEDDLKEMIQWMRNK